MAFEHEKREARRIIEGIENGSMDADETWALVEHADPTLVYLLVTWLRQNYANHPAAAGVIGRIVALTQAHPRVSKIMKSGADDPIVDWFEGEYAYRDFGSEEFVDLIVEKLET
jgi:hypothetical protein